MPQSNSRDIFHLIDLVLVHGAIGFADPSASIKQSEGELVIPLVRERGHRGHIVVPWTVEADDKGSPYKVRLSIIISVMLS